MRTLITAFCTLLTLLFFAAPAEYAHAAVPSTLNYQGMLSSNTGQPLTGTHDITFSLYGDGGTRFWQETKNVTFDGSGRFSVTLGGDSGNPLDPKDFTGTTFIGIQVGSEPELAPRQQLTSVAYAFQSFLGGVPVGTILEYAGSTAPDGFLLCRGGKVSRTTYSALFAIIGTTYGAGDGSTTFNLPDKRNRTSFGAGSTYKLGDKIGSATVNLSHRHSGPSHTHAGPNHRHSGPNHTHSFVHEHYVSRVNNGTSWSESGGGLEHGGDYGGLTMQGSQSPTTTSGGGTGNTGFSGTGNTGSGGTGNTGSAGNTAQSIMNPGLATNFIIKH
ncbi:Phage Tail Collar Domain [Candidatus Electrothrix aarhusensis]|uniref:Phage Tail Collar Domain n=1 Tax=Candidatus Electrothrix aarhusensis TaxID=1859131 RepID=A0A3S3QDH0_9BACT|nr:Phage Tail Collar Domain [Candidatus Electrothrix aarhusensis]